MGGWRVWECFLNNIIMGGEGLGVLQLQPSTHIEFTVQYPSTHTLAEWREPPVCGPDFRIFEPPLQTSLDVATLGKHSISHSNSFVFSLLQYVIFIANVIPLNYGILLSTKWRLHTFLKTRVIETDAAAFKQAAILAQWFSNAGGPGSPNSANPSGCLNYVLPNFTSSAWLANLHFPMQGMDRGKAFSQGNCFHLFCGHK